MRDRVDGVIAEFDAARVRALALDVTDPRALAKALRGSEFCINSVLTFAGHQMANFNACLEAGAAYADLGGMRVYKVLQKAQHKFGAPRVT